MIRSMRVAGIGLLACAGLAGIAFAGGRQTPMAQAQNTACTSNLKQIALGALMYIQDYDETLPPMKSMAVTQKVIMPYIKNNQIFTCPATSKIYKTNTAISQKTLASFAAPAKAPLFFDAAAHPDGSWGVAYLDGHVKREPKAPVIPKAKATPKKGHGKRK